MSKKKIFEYKPERGKMWTIETPIALKNDFFGMPDEFIPDFHNFIIKHCPESWEVIRLKYGIWPLFNDAWPLDERMAYPGEKELCTKLGITEEEYEDRWLIAQEAWSQEVDKIHDRKMLAAPKQAEFKVNSESAPAVQMAITQQDRDILLQNGFTDDMFDLPDRSELAKILEVKWFTAFVQQKKKLFDNPMICDLARTAALTQLHVRRLDDETTSTPVKSGMFDQLLKTQERLHKRFQETWQQIQEMDSSVATSAHKTAFVGVVSEMIEAIKKARIDKNEELIDGLFTAFEIIVEMRAHVHNPTPRYRPGWVVAVLEAKRYLWDPTYTRKVPQEYLRLLDSTFRGNHEQAVSKGLIKLPDFTDEKQEYDDADLFRFAAEPEPTPLPQSDIVEGKQDGK